jgi:hypothetical protein
LFLSLAALHFSPLHFSLSICGYADLAFFISFPQCSAFTAVIVISMNATPHFICLALALPKFTNDLLLNILPYSLDNLD